MDLCWTRRRLGDGCTDKREMLKCKVKVNNLRTAEKPIENIWQLMSEHFPTRSLSNNFIKIRSLPASVQTLFLTHIAIYTKSDQDSVKYGRSAGVCAVRCQTGWQFLVFRVDIIRGILQQVCRALCSEILYVDRWEGSQKHNSCLI